MKYKSMYIPLFLALLLSALWFQLKMVEGFGFASGGDMAGFIVACVAFVMVILFLSLDV
jgi:hypothetical protein